MVKRNLTHPLLLGLLCAWLDTSLQGEVVVIRNARVVDGTGAPARNATVIIRDSRIESATADSGVPTPAGAKVIDAAGRTLLPGLFDLHTHLAASVATGLSGDWGKSMKAYLAAGVSTVNDFSAYSEMFSPQRRLIGGANHLASSEFR